MWYYIIFRQHYFQSTIFKQIINFTRRWHEIILKATIWGWPTLILDQLWIKCTVHLFYSVNFPRILQYLVPYQIRRFNVILPPLSTPPSLLGRILSVFLSCLFIWFDSLLSICDRLILYTCLTLEYIHNVGLVD